MLKYSSLVPVRQFYGDRRELELLPVHIVHAPRPGVTMANRTAALVHVVDSA